MIFTPEYRGCQVRDRNAVISLFGDGERAKGADKLMGVVLYIVLGKRALR